MTHHPKMTHLDSTMGRLIELKNELVQQQMNIFQFHEPILKEMELTPDDYRFPVPKYITWDRKSQLKNRSERMNDIISQLPPKEQPEQAVSTDFTTWL